MNLRRIGVLLRKEVVWGPRNFLFIWAIIVPLVLTLVIQLLVGSFFSGKPWLGVVDAGASQVVTELQGMEGLVVQVYGTEEELNTAVASGIVDMGISLPSNFDEQLLRESDTPAALTAYVYGESLMSDRIILGLALVNSIRAITGQESPVSISTEIIGDGTDMPWSQRLLPFVVMMSIILGGTMLPAASLVEEKQKRTLTAVVTTTATLEEIFASKAILGFVVSFSMGLTTLILNQALNQQSPLLFLVLGMGALLSALFGVILGALVKDINSLFATIKGIGILLYAPALIYLFPTLPQWTAQLFPTYYMIHPIIAITQEGATWADIGWEVIVLGGLILLLLGIVLYLARQARTRPNLLPGIVS